MLVPAHHSLSLLQVGVSHDRMQGAVKEYEGRVLSLQEELEFTRSSYSIACQEIIDMKDELVSLGSLQDQQKLLVLEVMCKGGWVGVVCVMLVLEVMYEGGWVWSVQNQQLYSVLEVYCSY